jgi:hypothetical protein
VGDGDDTLDKGGDVRKLEVVKGGKPDDTVSEDCAESIKLIDQVRADIVAGRVTSLFLFALSSEGSLTRLILSNNRFELAGLALEVEKMIEEEAV